MTFAGVQVPNPAQTLSDVATQLRESAYMPGKTCLVMLAGLPGTGKSYLARLLSVHLGAAIVGTDHVRKTFFPQPAYSPDEGGSVYQLCFTLMEVLLMGGTPVIFDATNQAEWQRHRVQELAERLGVPLLIVETVAPEQVARRRLEKRASSLADGVGDPFDLSDAKQQDIYERIEHRFQPISEPHITVDTSGDIDAAIQAIRATVESA